MHEVQYGIVRAGWGGFAGVGGHAFRASVRAAAPADSPLTGVSRWRGREFSHRPRAPCSGASCSLIPAGHRVMELGNQHVPDRVVEPVSIVAETASDVR